MRCSLPSRLSHDRTVAQTPSLFVGLVALGMGIMSGRLSTGIRCRDALHGLLGRQILPIIKLCLLRVCGVRRLFALSSVCLLASQAPVGTQPRILSGVRCAFCEGEQKFIRSLAMSTCFFPARVC